MLNKIFNTSLRSTLNDLLHETPNGSEINYYILIWIKFYNLLLVKK